ncbi:unnamed protein product, partial [Hapterophycus canaliculatus]
LERAATEGDEGLTRRLLDAGADVGTAVHHTTESSHGAIVVFLLEKGAFVDTKDRDGNTPVHLAARTGSLEIARSL